ncbi:MAG: hypothetical protein M3552_03775 [Planctomycetota bacterium]|nr:hypothetical protein [Planctomycetaceae bacterium]MDQ3329760.1 hypothetical protein [Planctomycetota bacterium]
MASEPRPAASRTDLQQTIWQRRMNRLRGWLAVSCLALVASTWKLWTPQTVFPQIPFLAALRTAPAWLDWLALALMLVALVAMLALSLINRCRPAPAGRDANLALPTSDNAISLPSPSGKGLGVGGQIGRDSASEANCPSERTSSPSLLPRGHRGRNRKVALLFVASLALLVLLDQHRFQPWAYQFGIVAIVLAFAPSGRGASLLRVLTIGIYFWSAVSKLDDGFLRTTGPDLLRALFGVVGFEPPGIARLSLATLAWLLPLSELAVAILLSIRSTRAFGLGLAISMHLALMLTLGPLGLRSAAGVLLWNIYFVGQDLVLFWKPARGWHGAAGETGGRLRLREFGAGVVPAVRTIGVEHIVVALAVWLPILEPFGWFDHWPAWAVYAPRGERVSLLLYMPAERVPAELRKFLRHGGWDGHHVFRTDLWSLDALKAPLYPQERFRVGVALGFLNRYRIEDGEAGDYAVLVSKSRPMPHDWMPGTLAIRDYAGSFRLNALPRKLGGW